VFAAGEGYQIAGWRKSTERVAAFEFAALPDSYAARTGRPDNVGVIGVALFREAAPPSVALQDRGAAARAAPEAAPPAAPSAESRLGTAHGRSEASAATYTDFERASAIPDEVIAIRYDRRENLIAMGVIAPPIAPTPNPVPFPASTGGFVPDPPSR
jgi:hypothetical protein